MLFRSAPPTKDAAAVHRGEAKVESIAKDAITLSHGPIADLQWPPMTMDFKLPAGNLVKDVRTGDRVTFEFKLANDGQAELTAIKRSSAAAQSDKK